MIKETFRADLGMRRWVLSLRVGIDTLFLVNAFVWDSCNYSISSQSSFLRAWSNSGTETFIKVLFILEKYQK